MKNKIRLIASTCLVGMLAHEIGWATDISQKHVYSTKTPYGTVKVIRSSDGQIDVVTVSGKKIFEKCCYIGIYGKSQLPDGISVLIGVNGGGNTIPENEDFYIILKPDSDPVVMPGPGYHRKKRCKKGTPCNQDLP